MPNLEFKHALIVGAGAGLSASLARTLAHEGLAVSLAARSTDDLAPLAQETGARAFACDASKPSDVERLFSALDVAPGAPDIAIYNASFRTRGPLIELNPDDVERSLAVTAFGAFLVAQQAARRMLPKRAGAILLTGASAGVKGYAQSAPFAMGKFALRGLAQSMARELHPQGIHVAHVIVDGAIDTEWIKANFPDRYDAGPDAILNPDHIAETYWQLHRQPRSAWTFEMDLRPWKETW